MSHTILLFITRAASRLLWFPPQITRGRDRQAASKAADWLQGATRGVIHIYWLARLRLGMGNTVVRVNTRKAIFTNHEQGWCPTSRSSPV